MIILGVLFVIWAIYLIFFDKNIDGAVPEVNAEMQTLEAAKPKADAKGFVLCALTGIVLCAMNWIAALLA